VTTKLKKIQFNRVDLVPDGANQDAYVMLYKATWTQAFENTLPDSAFAYVEPGEKDETGRTTPRSKRHLPYKDADGPDAAHVRNALARLSQTDIPARAQASARRKLVAAARQLGIEVSAKQAMMPMETDDQAEPPPMTLEERQQSRQLWQQWTPLWWDFCCTVQDVMDGDEDDPGYADILMQSIDQFRTQARTLLDGLGLLAKAAPLLEVLDAVSKAGAALSAARRAKIQEVIALLQQMVDEAMPKAPMPTEKGAQMAQTLDLDALTAQVQALTTRAETAEAERDAARADLAKARQTPAEQEAAYLASLPEAVRKLYDADRLEKAELRRKLDASEARVAQQDYTAQAASFRALPLNPAEDWEVFKAIAELPSTTVTLAKAAGADQATLDARLTTSTRVAERLLQILKAADEAMRTSGLLRELGVNGTGPTGGTAEARALGLAKAKQAANSDLAFTAALDQVWRENDGLYAQYHAEKRSHRS
jgi:hypothetical protein